MFKSLGKKMGKYSHLLTSAVAFALVVVASTGAGTRSWILGYQPEPPK